MEGVEEQTSQTMSDGTETEAEKEARLVRERKQREADQTRQAVEREQARLAAERGAGGGAGAAAGVSEPGSRVSAEETEAGQE